MRRLARGVVADALGRCGGDGASAPTDAVAVQRLFDYFAGEIFERRCGRSSGFSGADGAAAALVRRSDGEAALRRGASGGPPERSRSRAPFHAAERLVPPTYQYHPLFREFLLTRAREARCAGLGGAAAVRGRGAELSGATRRRASHLCRRRRVGRRDAARLRAGAALRRRRPFGCDRDCACQGAAACVRARAVALVLAGRVSSAQGSRRGGGCVRDRVHEVLASATTARACIAPGPRPCTRRSTRSATWSSVDVWFERFVALRREYPQFPTVDIENSVSLRASSRSSCAHRSPRFPRGARRTRNGCSGSRRRRQACAPR